MGGVRRMAAIDFAKKIALTSEQNGWTESSGTMQQTKLADKQFEKLRTLLREEGRQTPSNVGFVVFQVVKYEPVEDSTFWAQLRVHKVRSGDNKGKPYGRLFFQWKTDGNGKVKKQPIKKQPAKKAPPRRSN
jgi:hypothetical protein